MSDKNKQLLNESTVRRFMGLAGIGALSDNTVEKLQEQEELEALPAEDPMADLAPDDEMPEDPMADEDDEESADVDLTAEEAEVIIALGDKLKAEMGDEEGLEGEPAEDAEMDAEMPPPMPEDQGPPMQEAFVRELSNRVAQRVAHEHAINEEVNRRVAAQLRKEQIINETMKRVAKRLSPRRK